MNTLLDPARLQSQPLSHARALPAEFYTDPRSVALDRRTIFQRNWQLVSHVSRVPNAGDYLATEIAGLPVLLVRDEHGTVRVFHNVCRHRAAPIARGAGCGLKRLRCSYHGWTYGLDGVLRSAPEMGTAPDFDPRDIRLPELRSEIWQGLVFVAEGTAPPFADYVAGIDARLGTRTLSDYRFHRQVVYDVGCNWKVYVDNYLEGYHVPHIHPGLNRLLDYRTYITEVHDWYSFQFSPMESASELYGSGDALYYFMHPNTMLNSLPDRLQTNRVIPVGVDRCRVEFDYYYPADDSEEAEARRARDLAFSDEVQLEDGGLCEDVHRGLASGSYVPGRLNPLRENAVHHFHELLRRAWREEIGA